MAKSQKQVGKLLGKNSPLTRKQKATLRREIREGTVKVSKRRKK